jgi:RNA polymerase sigma-70 factor (ECF subfamily)
VPNVNKEDKALELMNAHKGMVIKIIRSFPLQDLEEGDAFNEIYLSLSRALQSFRGESKVSTWLYRVCVNTLLQFKRREKPINPIEGHEAEGQESNFSTSQLLQSALATLNEADRALILMHLEGFQQKEIASAFGISQQNVGVKVHRIKKTLQEWILQQ